MALDDAPPGPASDMLHGWKEIAAYLGKSVRSAQRWEQELGLPTHRIKTPDAQIVYALRSEIDAWRRSLDPKARKLEERDADRDKAASPVVAGQSPAGARWRSLRGWRGWALTLLAVGAIAAWWEWRRTGDASQSAKLNLSLVGRELRATRADGSLAWMHRFDRDVAVPPPTTMFAPTHQGTVAVTEVDVDGDGLRDYLIPLHTGGAIRFEADTLVAVSSTGRVLWQVSGDRTLRCGGQSFSAPWRPTAVALSPTSGRVWLSYTHHTWWPSYVVEVMADGRQELRYVQPGWVMDLIEWTTPDGPRIAAGGVLNQHQQASLVLIDPAAPLTSFAAGDTAFACEIEDAVSPVRVVLFPNFEVPQALGNPYVMADQLARVGGDLKVDLVEHVVARVSPEGTVLELALTDNYRFMHRELQQKGTLAHSEAECPDRTAPKTVRRWSPDRGWETQEIALTVR